MSATASAPTPNTSAAIWTIAVLEPLPISLIPAIRCTVPSSLSLTQDPDPRPPPMFAGLLRPRFPPASGLGGTIQRLPHPNMAQSNPSARGPALTHAVATPKLDRVEAGGVRDD